MSWYGNKTNQAHGATLVSRGKVYGIRCDTYSEPQGIDAAATCVRQCDFVVENGALQLLSFKYGL